ncbi:MAG: carboxymuconolactone decarboxylase family protein [Cetobacterium sp.]
MAIKQGATLDEIKELLLFISPYVAFAKTASAFGVLNELLESEAVKF